MKHFDNVNADLIYGWSGQDEKTWNRDLEILCAVRPHHVSLYSLTYEPATVIGRRKERGLIIPDTDERLAGYYDLAKEKLKKEGYLHEEISNWHLEGKEAFHNNLYWTAENYIGIGLGAHGYLPSEGNFGLRYSFLKTGINFLKVQAIISMTWRAGLEADKPIPKKTETGKTGFSNTLAAACVASQVSI